MFKYLKLRYILLEGVLILKVENFETAVVGRQLSQKAGTF